MQILTIVLAFGGIVFASHSFETGVSAGSSPDKSILTRWNDITTKSNFPSL